jgi:hypothetical protein
LLDTRYNMVVGTSSGDSALARFGQHGVALVRQDMASHTTHISNDRAAVAFSSSSFLFAPNSAPRVTPARAGWSNVL